MNLQEISQQLHLKLLTEPQDLRQIQVTGGYTSDLLSCVMAGAQPGNLWVTLQAHINIVAVAALTDCAAIIITEEAMPEEDVIGKANAQGVIMFLTTMQNYETSARLWNLLHNLGRD